MLRRFVRKYEKIVLHKKYNLSKFGFLDEINREKFSNLLYSIYTGEIGYKEVKEMKKIVYKIRYGGLLPLFAFAVQLRNENAINENLVDIMYLVSSDIYEKVSVLKQFVDVDLKLFFNDILNILFGRKRKLRFLLGIIGTSILFNVFSFLHYCGIL
jgi:hypothetical protein